MIYLAKTIYKICTLTFDMFNEYSEWNVGKFWEEDIGNEQNSQKITKLCATLYSIQSYCFGLYRSIRSRTQHVFLISASNQSESQYNQHIPAKLINNHRQNPGETPRNDQTARIRKRCHPRSCQPLFISSWRIYTDSTSLPVLCADIL